MIRRNKQIHLNSTRFRQQKKEEEEQEDVHTPQTMGERACFPRYWSSMGKGAILCYKSRAFERNLANQTIGCTSRKKDTGPRKTPNPSTNVKKKIRALPPVRKSNQLFLLLSLRQMFFTKPCHFFCFFALIVQVHHPLQTKVFENWFSA
jgi:hypothetical protein